MNLVALVLAAGSARRFGSDKLSALLDGEPLVAHAIRAARAAPVDRVIVVARPGLQLGEWPGSPPVDVIRIASDAMSTSLKAGIAAAAGADGAFVFLGDMPRVPHGEAACLAAMLESAYAALPRHQGRPGHPVLLSAWAFPDIAGLAGDTGAGPLLKHRDDLVFHDCATPAILLDVDRPEDLGQLADKDRSLPE